MYSKIRVAKNFGFTKHKGIKKNLKCFLVVIYKDNKVIMILPFVLKKNLN